MMVFFMIVRKLLFLTKKKTSFVLLNKLNKQIFTKGKEINFL